MLKKVFLASKSPRRQELLKQMNIDFQLLLKDVNEDFPTDLEPLKVAEYIAVKKANAFELKDQDAILITADTVVIIDNEILGKPVDENDAIAMLGKLNGKTHQVVTGVAIKSINNISSFDCITKVTFNAISKGDIEYYVKNHQPLDKAGAYGIQDWIGAVAVNSIIGSYTNVMGLPTHELYERLKKYF
jgi:septum formation protein